MRTTLGAAAPSGLDLTRRTLLLGGAGALLAACTPLAQTLEPEPEVITDPALAYAAVKDGDYDLPAISPKILKPEFMRAVVDYQTDQKPGTIIVDPAARHLYFVLRNGRAIRYGVGVGRQGFAWNGGAVIRFKAVWPKWTPPSEMIDRQPELEKYRKGMPGGPKNPLGARALYLYQGMQDTLYRIHGTNDPRSIGRNVSSGCIRMINQDIIDLYGRTPLGTKVVVLGDAQPTGS